jgi:hypothetical protein
MSLRLSKIAIAVVAATGLAACGGSDNDNNGGGGGGGGEPSNFQQDLVDNGQVQFQDGASLSTFSLDSTSFAVDTGSVTADTSLPSGSGATDESYFGAVDPGASSPYWWEGWTAHVAGGDGSLKDQDIHPLSDNLANTQAPNLDPAGSNACSTLDADFEDGGTVDLNGENFPVCVIDSDDLTNNDGSTGQPTTVTLPANHVYVLDGFVNVGNGGAEQATQGSVPNSMTLAMDPGVQIFGATETDGSLVITRGSDIEVNGTAAAPVVFSGVETDLSQVGSGDVITDSTPLDLSGRGTFGGVVVDGWATINNANANDEASSEVDRDLQDGLRFYGGTDDADNSGTITYAVIAESGVAFRANEEIQGLTLEGVGSGTTINHVQVLGSEDDGIEWFGGTVDASYLVINGMDDDGLDMDLGYRGTIQYAIVRVGDSNGNRGIESDGNGDNFDATPATEPFLANITILGNAGRSDETTTGALHREGWQGQVYASVYMDDTAAGTQFEGGCLDVDDQKPSELQYRDVIFSCSPQNIASADD